MTDTKPARLDSIDLLRGLAMIVMALDHVRDFFHDARFDPLDLAVTTPVLFLTRWVTHHCAPAFVFLAGTGAFLSLSRGRTTKDLARFLLTRGLWLVVVELTIVRLAWLFNFDYSLMIGQVIWAIGWSMVALSGLIFLPRKMLAILAVGMIISHNLFDGINPSSLGSWGWLWQVLHVQSFVALGKDIGFFVAYPLIPWIGVMAAGYLFGGLLQTETPLRRKRLYRLGWGLIAAFLLLRAINVYGDPDPWSLQGTAVNTVLSFLNTTKYPPSLQYLLMTLGPAIVVLPLLERWKGRTADFVVVFGRVPMFYYVLHLFLIHTLAVFAALATVEEISFLFSNILWFNWPPGYGFSLPVVYAVWVFVVLALYLPCRWFAEVKRRRKDPWLSYL